jgi:hypothetical protein
VASLLLVHLGVFHLGVLFDTSASCSAGLFPNVGDIHHISQGFPGTPVHVVATLKKLKSKCQSRLHAIATLRKEVVEALSMRVVA